MGCRQQRNRCRAPLLVSCPPEEHPSWLFDVELERQVSDEAQQRALDLQRMTRSETVRAEQPTYPSQGEHFIFKSKKKTKQKRYKSKKKV